MTFNPCGRVVDFSRRPFDMTARPWKGSDQEVTIRWYPAADDALPLETPSAILVPDWEFDKEDFPFPVVSKWEEWPGNPYNRAKVIPGTGRGHVCGTPEQFAGESELDPDADQQYRPDGLPVCCDPKLDLAGGAGASGQGELTEPSFIDLSGVTCADASPLVLGQVYRWTASSIVAQQYWYAPNGTAAIDRYLRLTAISGTGAELTVRSSLGCGSFSAPTTDISAVGCYNCPVDGGGSFFPDTQINMQGGAGADCSYEWQLSDVPC